MRKREYQFLVIIFQNLTSSYSAKINEILAQDELSDKIIITMIMVCITIEGSIF